MSKEKDTTKREVESFLNEYGVDRVKLSDDIDLMKVLCFLRFCIMWWILKDQMGILS